LSETLKKISEDKEWEFEEKLEFLKSEQLSKEIEKYEKTILQLKQEIEQLKKVPELTQTSNPSRKIRKTTNTKVGTQTEWLIAEDKTKYGTRNKSK
jgi:hypothetical protein